MEKQEWAVSCREAGTDGNRGRFHVLTAGMKGSQVAVLPGAVDRLMKELPDDAGIANIVVCSAPGKNPDWLEIFIDYTTMDSQNTLIGLLGPMPRKK